MPSANNRNANRPASGLSRSRDVRHAMRVQSRSGGQNNKKRDQVGDRHADIGVHTDAL